MGNFFEIKDVVYTVTRSEDNVRRFVVAPELQIHSEKDSILLGCLLIDSFEMHPSLRIVVKKGGNKVSIKPVAIVLPEEKEINYVYKMELKVSRDGQEYQSHLSELTLG